MNSRQFLFTAAFLLGTAGWAQEQAPSEISLPRLNVAVRGKTQSLKLRELKVDVVLDGRVAETIFELEFFNHTRIRQEGEFVLQLPKNATVSTYALEIRGKMRPGVSVEKEKARNAYESIKRKMIDPGLVEREEGNVYRTRIFPIEPESPKRVRIGFIHPLPEDGRYTLPLRLKEKLREFAGSISGASAQPELIGCGIREKKPVNDLRRWEWATSHRELDQVLIASSLLPEVGKTRNHIDRGRPSSENLHFLAQGRIGRDEEANARRRWPRVRLIWDTSFSGRWRDREKEIEAVQRIWNWLGNCEVSVELLDTRLRRVLDARVSNGEAPEVEQVLREAVYDGAADFSRIAPFDGLTLLVTDGQISSPIQTPSADGLRDFFVITSTAEGMADPLLQSTGCWLDLRADDWLDKLASPTAGLTLEGMPNRDWDIAVNGLDFAVTGRIPKKFPGKISLRVPGQGSVEIYSPKRDGHSSNSEWNFTRRVWAQRRLERLELSGDSRQITAFARAERLVSDFTSLIVLERFEDHIRYRIPPPEPDLLAEYELQVKKEQHSSQGRIQRQWRNKISWHNTRFPWLDEDLEQEIATVGVWVKSSLAAFPEEKRNHEELKPYRNWLSEARKISEAKSRLQSRKDLEEWQKQITRQIEAIDKIRLLPYRPDETHPVHVSVRGFVRQRGVYSKKTPFGLREAVEKAGGPNSFGSWSRVYLYRDAQRTGYNLQSNRFSGAPLRWGDMIVVERPPPTPTFLGDGFADPFSDGEPIRNNAPVFEEPGKRALRPSSARKITHAAPFAGGGGGMDSDPAANAPVLSGSFLPRKERRVSGVDEAVLEALKKHPSPEDHYLEMLKGDFGKNPVSMGTIIETARFFFQRNQPELAERILSNLLELQNHPIEATRSLAYWLAELRSASEAVEIFKALADVAPDESTRALALFDAAQCSEKPAELYRRSAETEMRVSEPSVLPVIALTGHFRHSDPKWNQLPAFEANALPSDVRVVITLAGRDGTLEVVEPGGRNPMTDHGGRTLEHPRVKEFQIRRALPGTYRFSLIRWSGDNAPLTVHGEYFIRWASGEETKETFTMLIDSPREKLPALEFGWPEKE